MKNKKQSAIEFAMAELQKVFADLQKGKRPTFPKSLDKILDVVEKANKKQIEEDEAEKLITSIIDKESEK